LFVEVNHGPFVVDNNLFLSGANLLDMSEGGAYAHNLFNGTLISAPELNRQTPYHPAHSTSIAGLANVEGGDCRFYNNLFVGRGGTSASEPSCGLASYNRREVPLQTGGNVFYCGAQPYAHESNGTVTLTFDPQLKLLRQNDRLSLRFNPGIDLKQSKTRPVETARLGKAQVSGLPYENADGSSFKVDLDFLGQPRSKSTPTPGPFENPTAAPLLLPRRGLEGLTD
jgi:hypothetical protein